MTKPGKRARAIAETVDRDKAYTVSEAVSLVKANAKTKFDETIDIAVNLGVDPKYADQMVRGVVNLPSGTGKDVRVAVFAKDAKADEAKAAGADFVGAEDLMEKIQGDAKRRPSRQGCEVRFGRIPCREGRYYPRRYRQGKFQSGRHREKRKRVSQCARQSPPNWRKRHVRAQDLPVFDDGRWRDD